MFVISPPPLHTHTKNDKQYKFVFVLVRNSLTTLVVVIIVISMWVFLQNYQQPPVDYESNKELKKLQFYGAGPKAALPDLSNEGNSSEI